MSKASGSPQYSPAVKKAKDIAAGAVLLASIGAAAIGARVFVPFLVEKLSGYRHPNCRPSRLCLPPSLRAERSNPEPSSRPWIASLRSQ
ncbi:diacylglycerol kinase [Methylocystis sp. S23]